MLEVIDRGRGLVPGAVPGFGVRGSMQARMAEVGGSATVESGPGGTNVRDTTVSASVVSDRVVPVSCDGSARGAIVR